jgi:hypothetical protein
MLAIAEACTALPTTKKASSATPLKRPRWAKNRIWNSGLPSIVGM